ncbi:hypothetical protein [Pseudoalteromonas marina]|uniref:DUF4376 domain-containing protein n=1 Tax=Pseudoalteromonas marina TaxID=267375 RepID=A0ABT9FGC4_9GAMM|nr:hypothetical protein [Pseudoalteromonas marina]MDP2565832.1 hypothetical protein [Pseudoalteromonas marina]
MKANEIIEAAQKRSYIHHPKTGNTYKVTGFRKHKRSNDEWVETVDYENEEGAKFSRTAEMFSTFTLSTKSAPLDPRFDEAVSTLKLLRKVQEEKNVIMQYGVDLTNYESGIHERLTVICSLLLGCDVKDIEWWLYDSSEGYRQYTFTDSDIEVDLEKAEAFATYHYQKEKAI